MDFLAKSKKKRHKQSKKLLQDFTSSSLCLCLLPGKCGKHGIRNAVYPRRTLCTRRTGCDDWPARSTSARYACNDRHGARRHGSRASWKSCRACVNNRCDLPKKWYRVCTWNDWLASPYDRDARAGVSARYAHAAAGYNYRPSDWENQMVGLGYCGRDSALRC